jgi:hypothetical protein
MSIIEKVKKNLRVASGMCPKGHSLMSGERTFDGQKAITLTVRNRGQEGTIYLNPFYGRFEYECDIAAERGDIVELFCPECETSLEIAETCRMCNIPMFAVHLPDGGQVEACPKVGCHNHSLKIVDLDAQLERMYVDEETRFQM